MNLTKEQLLVLMNTIDFCQDFASNPEGSYEEYTIIESGTDDLDPIRDILYNEYIHQTQQGGK